MKIKINRWEHKDCIIGRLVCGDFQCFTLELPYLDNQQNISSIPYGDYRFFKRKSDRNGDVIQLRNVIRRSYIQIHAGNYTSQVRGCILVGDGVKWLNDDKIPDVTNSKATLIKLLDVCGPDGVIEIE